MLVNFTKYYLESCVFYAEGFICLSFFMRWIEEKGLQAHFIMYLLYTLLFCR